MGYDPERHHRRSIRLRGYDYGQPGRYFVTICVQGRGCLFGDVVNGEVRLSKAGVVVESWWGTIPRRFPGVTLDAYVVMPNHLHGIVMIESNDRWDSVAENKRRVSLPRIVQWFKSATTSDYQRGVISDGWEPIAGRLWQRNYYEHVVRDEADLKRIREYIAENPARWAEDEEHPERHPWDIGVVGADRRVCPVLVLAIQRQLAAGLPAEYSSTERAEKAAAVYQHIFDAYAGAGQSIYRLDGWVSGARAAYHV